MNTAYRIPCERNGWHVDDAADRREAWMEQQLDALWSDADALQDALANQLETPPDIEVCDALVRAAARGDELITKLSWWLDPILRQAVENLESVRAEP